MVQLQKKKWGKKCLEVSVIEGGGGGVGRLMANVVLNSQFDIFCILPLVEEYKVDLSDFLLGLFCILAIIVILYL